MESERAPETQYLETSTQRRLSLKDFNMPDGETIRERAGFMLKFARETVLDPQDVINLKTHLGTDSVKISCPILCFSFIEGLSNMLIESSQNSLPDAFILSFDAACGMDMVADCIELAEKTIGGKPDDFIEELGERLPNLINKRKGQAHVCAELLKKDPTGFLLVDEVVCAIAGKEDALLKDLLPKLDVAQLIKEYVVAGAEAGAILYKRFYKLCPPPKPIT